MFMDEQCLQYKIQAFRRKKQARFDAQFCFENLLDKKCNPNIPVVVARCRQKTMLKYQCTKYRYRHNIMQSKLLTGMWSLDVGGFCYLLCKYVCKYLNIHKIHIWVCLPYRLACMSPPKPFFETFPYLELTGFRCFALTLFGVGVSTFGVDTPFFQVDHIFFGHIIFRCFFFNFGLTLVLQPGQSSCDNVVLGAK